MDFAEWGPYYFRILDDFGFDRETDERAARVLSEILPPGPVDLEPLKRLLSGRSVLVVGGSGNLDAEPSKEAMVIAADAATTLLLESGILPDIIVTDLDGHVPDQVEANRKGSLVLVHAHGDNIPLIEEWAGRFPGPVIGTTQSVPLENVLNFGGFTDGDRGVFVASHFRAAEIGLSGFDFDRVGTLKESDTGTKLKKLGWARYLIGEVLGMPMDG